MEAHEAAFRRRLTALAAAANASPRRGAAADIGAVVNDLLSEDGDAPEASPSLSALRTRLQALHSRVRGELANIINRDYAAFVTLSTQLDGFDKALNQLRPPIVTTARRLTDAKRAVQRHCLAAAATRAGAAAAPTLLAALQAVTAATATTAALMRDAPALVRRCRALAADGGAAEPALADTLHDLAAAVGAYAAVVDSLVRHRERLAPGTANCAAVCDEWDAFAATAVEGIGGEVPAVGDAAHVTAATASPLAQVVRELAASPAGEAAAASAAVSASEPAEIAALRLLVSELQAAEAGVTRAIDGDCLAVARALEAAVLAAAAALVTPTTAGAAAHDAILLHCVALAGCARPFVAMVTDSLTRPLLEETLQPAVLDGGGIRGTLQAAPRTLDALAAMLLGGGSSDPAATAVAAVGGLAPKAVACASRLRSLLAAQGTVFAAVAGRDSLAHSASSSRGTAAAGGDRDHSCLAIGVCVLVDCLWLPLVCHLTGRAYPPPSAHTAATSTAHRPTPSSPVLTASAAGTAVAAAAVGGGGGGGIVRRGAPAIASPGAPTASSTRGATASGAGVPAASSGTTVSAASAALASAWFSPALPAVFHATYSALAAFYQRLRIAAAGATFSPTPPMLRLLAASSGSIADGSGGAATAPALLTLTIDVCAASMQAGAPAATYPVARLLEASGATRLLAATYKPKLAVYAQLRSADVLSRVDKALSLRLPAAIDEAVTAAAQAAIAPPGAPSSDLTRDMAATVVAAIHAAEAAARPQLGSLRWLGPTAPAIAAAAVAVWAPAAHLPPLGSEALLLTMAALAKYGVWLVTAAVHTATTRLPPPASVPPALAADAVMARFDAAAAPFTLPAEWLVSAKRGAAAVPPASTTAAGSGGGSSTTQVANPSVWTEVGLDALAALAADCDTFAAAACLALGPRIAAVLGDGVGSGTAPLPPLAAVGFGGAAGTAAADLSPLATALAAMLQRLRAAAAALRYAVSSAVAGAVCEAATTSIRAVPAAFRSTGRGLPTSPSIFVPTLLRPLRAALPHVGGLATAAAGAPTPALAVATEVLTHTGEHVRATVETVMANLVSMESSLSWLRRDAAGGGAAAAISDSDRVGRQLWLDVTSLLDDSRRLVATVAPAGTAAPASWTTGFEAALGLLARHAPT